MPFVSLLNTLRGRPVAADAAPASQDERGREPGPLQRVLDHPAVIGAGSLVLGLFMLGGHVRPLKAVTENGGDHGLMIWNLWIVNESLNHGQSPFHTDLVYFPLGARLAKHTLVAGFWPVTRLVQAVSGGDPLYPAYAYRASILLSFTLILALCFRLLRRLGVPQLASLAAAVQYAFCPFNQRHVPHLNHISAAFLLPLTALALLRLFERPSRWRAGQLGLVLATAVYFSELAAFLYLSLPVAVLAALAFRSARSRLVVVARALGAGGLLALSAAFLITLAPFAANWTSDAGKAPKTRQASNWSANAAAFFIPDPDYTPLYGRLFDGLNAWTSKGIGGHEAFLGFPLLIFGAAGLARSRGLRAVLASVALVFLVLSLGPTLKLGGINTWWPMPYAALMKVPPFEMGRTPVRCVLFAVFCLALLAGFGLADLGSWLRRRAGGLAAAALALLVLAWSMAEVYLPGPAPRPYTVPAALNQLEPGPVLNLPLSVFDGFAVFLQTLHGRPIGTGFVSRRTPAQVEHVRRLDQLLEQDATVFVAEVRRMGFRNLILGPGTPRTLVEQLQAQPIRVIDLRRQEAEPAASTLEPPEEPARP